jgi:hypothetical protein
MSVNWNFVVTIIGPLVPALIAILGYVNRKWLRQFFVDRAVLASENNELRAERQMLRNTNDSLNAQALAWRGAAEAGEFTKEDAKLLIARIQVLELVTPRFDAAMAHVGDLYRVIAVFESYFKDHNIVVPAQVPPMPFILQQEQK